jgi:hypothetical protein
MRGKSLIFGVFVKLLSSITLLNESFYYRKAGEMFPCLN